MSKLVVSLWQGKPLEEHEKAELINIVCELGKLLEQQSKSHIHDLEMLGNTEKKSISLSWSCGVKPFCEHRYNFTAKIHAKLAKSKIKDK